VSTFSIRERAFDVLGYLRKRGKVQQSGNDAILQCPDCEKPKLWVLLKEKRDGTLAGSWLCYRCGTGGRGAISLVQKLEDCDRLRALEIIRDGTSDEERVIDLKQELTNLETGTRRQRFTEIELPEGYTTRGPIPKFFSDCGITAQQMRKHGIGWCMSGRYRGRMITPVRAPDDGPVVSFVARLMREKREGEKKVLYPKKVTEETVLAACLFNYDVAKEQRLIVIVEDDRSALRVGRAAVGTWGTNLGPGHLRLLLATKAEEIALMYDRDAMVRHTKYRCAGKCPHCARFEKTQKIREKLSQFWPVRYVVLPDKRDPKDHTRKQCWKFIDGAATENQEDSLESLISASL